MFSWQNNNRFSYRCNQQHERVLTMNYEDIESLSDDILAYAVMNEDYGNEFLEGSRPECLQKMIDD